MAELRSRQGKRPVRRDIADVLDLVENKHRDVTVYSSQDLKKNYSQELSKELARAIADELKERTPFMKAVHGERPVSGGAGQKRTDIRVSDEVSGVKLVVSVKTTNFRDLEKRQNIRDFNHNHDRFDNEFRSEAYEIHKKQPYAVLVGLFFLPHESVVPRTRGKESGFSRWVIKLRGRAGRCDHTDEPGLFECIFVGLYVRTGANRGALRFFDVRERPPRYGFPNEESLMDLPTLLDQIERSYEERNPPRPEPGPPGTWSSAALGTLPDDFAGLGYEALQAFEL